MAKKVYISGEYIKLDCAVKFCGESVTGSEAKAIIAHGGVTVNGETEFRRGKKLYNGDVFCVNGNEYEIFPR
ncbi:MAG: RNA-binding S4 domain-containing protein [Clostridia bacterium]|nr:RNA-binding S4 domain-containing protein [Clostridia bacterium]